jgi:hypothetical protein
LQWRRGGRIAACVAALAVGAVGALAEAPPPLAPPLLYMPVEPVKITGGFGESRSNHFHAGLDFSTGGQVGAAVRAPLPGFVERVHTSGAGYGRSLYLHARDGRLLVFGHLDAYAPALAAWVDSAQRASGQYERDLWPAAGRFRFAAGDTIAWSGESGAGGPHLHMEIRHDDFALDPLRAGVTQPSDVKPRLESLVLEPLAESSFVARCASPHAVRLGARAETVVVQGPVRAIVRSRAGLPGRGIPAWSTSAQWGENRIEARLDSISWAGEMAEQDLVVDRGRVSGSMGFILSRLSIQPRFLEGPGTNWNGLIDVHAGDPARPLLLRARDAQGLEVERTVWMRGPRANELGVDSTRISRGIRRRRAGALRWSATSTGNGRMRLRLEGAPAGLRGVRLGFEEGPVAAAGWDGVGWSAILDVSRAARGGLLATGRRLGTPWALRQPAGVLPARASQAESWKLGELELALQPRSLFESEMLLSQPAIVPRAGELEPRSAAIAVGPSHTPLRHPATVALPLAPHESPVGVDLYRRDDDGGLRGLHAKWDDSSHVFRAETSELGAFVLMHDGRAPSIRLLPAARRVPPGPYPRWELKARITEAGSGVDPSESYFEIDGARVPSEWDPEARQLRWRPLQVPSPGAHQVRVRAADFAGNASERAGRFVLDSARR